MSQEKINNLIKEYFPDLFNISNQTHYVSYLYYLNDKDLYSKLGKPFEMLRTSEDKDILKIEFKIYKAYIEGNELELVINLKTKQISGCLTLDGTRAGEFITEQSCIDLFKMDIDVRYTSYYDPLDRYVYYDRVGIMRKITLQNIIEHEE